MILKREYFFNYETFKEFVKKAGTPIEIDIFYVTCRFHGLNTAKLYYWVLKMIEENLIKTVNFTPNPNKWASHHSDAEVSQCILKLYKKTGKETNG